MKSFLKGSYKILPTDEETANKTITARTSSDLDIDNVPRKRAWFALREPRLMSIATLIVPLALLSLSFALGFWASSHRTQTSALQVSLEQTSIYSPAFEAISYYETDFANAFNQKSQYRGPPTVELEKAWNDLWDHPEVSIPKDTMTHLNRSGSMLDNYLVNPEAEKESYIGGLEVFHQIHCLNYIRQFTWFLMDKYTEETLPTGFNIPLKALRMHTDHCIETLRLVLMCQSDVTPVLVKWGTMDPPVPEADFNSHHKCRNFEDIAAWNKKHAVKSWGTAPAHDHSHHRD
ncbi:hypothetical protein BBP40_005151 [Aspergillus hancockii]|nr:hypothetical protein BBP40_005151 [Aspergillus hancockii]